ncbi:PIN domain-containing protein [Phormidium sp. FACHB-1136]|uniref:type II toxin-antitoxin system VapC family toxin n=1 Tax=Phormidium sp. FACHB-1136 TaxID=2692848 RepID=UPI0018EFE242|nr:PIN domain-containing protein [Phormidium sp. FACHB-1136]
MANTMPDALFVDTGYVIALINQNDQHHQQALHLAERYDGYPLVTTDAILLEIGNALSRLARSEAATIIRYFQTASEVTLVPLTPDLLAAALALYAQHQDKTWGLVDCVSFVVMRNHHLSTVLGFDRHFVQAGFTLAS